MSENLENQSLIPENQNQDTATNVVCNDKSSISVKNESDAVMNANDTKDSSLLDKNVSNNADYDSLINAIQKIAEAKEKLNDELESKKQYLNNNLTKYDSENYFKNDSFRNLYSEAFDALGTNLDTDKFIELLDKYVESRINSYSKNLAAIRENNSATDSMNFNSGVSKTVVKKPKMQDIPENELQKYIAKYV